MTPLQTSDITQAVLDRLNNCTDARFKQVLSAVIRHVHALAVEVDLRPEEWMATIQFLTQAGQICDDKRQEFILLSDTLGLSMRVVELDQKRRSAAALSDGAASLAPTEATVQGPFYWEGSPELPLGSDIGQGMPGEPAYYSGRVTDTRGRALAGAEVDVWSGDGDGFYDMQLGSGVGMRLRARFRTALHWRDFRRCIALQVEQAFERVENFIATAAAHPAFRDLELVLHHSKDRSARGASCCQTHA